MTKNLRKPNRADKYTDIANGISCLMSWYGADDPRISLLRQDLDVEMTRRFARILTECSRESILAETRMRKWCRVSDELVEAGKRYMGKTARVHSEHVGVTPSADLCYSGA